MLCQQARAQAGDVELRARNGVPESTFYYTVDGSEPNLSGAVLDPQAPPLLYPVLGKPIVLKVLAIAPGSLPSDVTTVTHRKQKPRPAPVEVTPAEAVTPPVPVAAAARVPTTAVKNPTATVTAPAAIDPVTSTAGMAKGGGGGDEDKQTDDVSVLPPKIQVTAQAGLKKASTPTTGSATATRALPLKRRLPGKLTLQGKTGALVRSVHVLLSDSGCTCRTRQC